MSKIRNTRRVRNCRSYSDRLPKRKFWPSITSPVVGANILKQVGAANMKQHGVLKRNFRTLVATAIVGLLSACNQATINYSGPGNIESLKAARSICLKESKVIMKTPYSQRETCSAGKLKACLSEKGYTEQKDGSLKIPFSSDEFCQAP